MVGQPIGIVSRISTLFAKLVQTSVCMRHIQKWAVQRAASFLKSWKDTISIGGILLSRLKPRSAFCGLPPIPPFLCPNYSDGTGSTMLRTFMAYGVERSSKKHLESENAAYLPDSLSNSPCKIEYTAPISPFAVSGFYILNCAFKK